MTATDILGFAGILLIIGFLSDYLFKKARIPDVLILIVLGYLIGPVLGIIEPSQIAPASHMISSLALVIILFNGGMDLDFTKVLSVAPRAIFLVLLGIAASLALVAAFAYHLLGWELIDSLLLGAILSGTSPSIVMPLINRARVSADASSVLSLESAFNGALVIIIALVILEIISTGNAENGLSSVGQIIGIRFSLGAAIGAAAGFLWLWILTLIEGETYDDILTLAVVFLLYFTVENISGSGVIFALVFGLILGNGVKVAQILRIKRTVEIHDLMKKFHSQMSFLIKTFFFVYLGLMISFSNFDVIVQGIILSLMLLLARHIVVLLTSIGNSTLFADRGILTTMLPRGLSAAVIAEIVFASGIPNASAYPEITIAVIVITVVISAIGIPIFTRKSLRQTVEATAQEDDST